LIFVLQSDKKEKALIKLMQRNQYEEQKKSKEKKKLSERREASV